MLKYFLAALCLLMICAIAIADTVVLKDGTTVEGTVIKFGNQYRVKLADGQTKIITESSVKEIIKGGSPKPGPTGGAAPTPPKSTDPVPGPSAAAAAAPKGASAGFLATKAKADRVEAPIVAVSLWEKFIESKPSAADFQAANVELAKWQALQKDNAEKVNGKWIGGTERKDLLKKVSSIIEDAIKLEDGNTIKAISKYEEAVKLYPNSFEAHFRLGYFYLVKGGPQKYDQAIKSLEQAVRVQPKSPEALTNLAIAYTFRKRYEQAVLTAYKAVQIEDSKDLVENLLACFNSAPIGLQTNNAKMRPIMEEAKVLASKYGIGQAQGSFHYLPPGYSDSKRVAEGKPPVEKDQGGPPGIVGNGSGFLISEDGYVLTNRHVVDSGEGHFYRVRFDDGTEKNAEVVAIDEKADVALLKTSSDSPLPHLKIAADNPNPAAKALVLGFPATSMVGENTLVMQVSSGDVASINPGDSHEVWFHLDTTHGNSGGPIVDKNGRVIGILTAGNTVHNVTYVLGVGPLQIKRFFESIGDKAPKVEYAEPRPGEFDGEKLAQDARKATLLILIVRGDAKATGASTPGTDSGASSAAPEGATNPDAPRSGAGKKGAAGVAP
jgi:S1-C subfamily serine protease